MYTCAESVLIHKKHSIRFPLLTTAGGGITITSTNPLFRCQETMFTMGLSQYEYYCYPPSVSFFDIFISHRFLYSVVICMVLIFICLGLGVYVIERQRKSRRYKPDNSLASISLLSGLIELQVGDYDDDVVELPGFTALSELE